MESRDPVLELWLQPFVSDASQIRESFSKLFLVPRGSMVTGSLMFGLLAAGCQAGLNATGGGASLSQLPARIRAGLVDLIPMKPLSDKEYEDLLLDKLVKVEVEISLLDDQIANLRAARDKQVQLQGMQSKDSPT